MTSTEKSVYRCAVGFSGMSDVRTSSILRVRGRGEGRGGFASRSSLFGEDIFAQFRRGGPGMCLGKEWL